MSSIDAFWEVPGFWAMAGVLILFAAVATLLVVTGPTEAPYDDNDDQF
ncbi:hypothetical protein QEH68_06570 [Paenarthrobacter sp. OM7]|nr:hypothetical protein [Paenarthrobacter sp. OM7]WGM21832.1 hypothetical protein QEH68_06570 [Paenarthrobacter sp. OM7]